MVAMSQELDDETERGEYERMRHTPSEQVRNWVTQAEIDGGVRPGTTTDDAQRIAELERESRELRSRLLHRCTSGQGVATRSSFSPRRTISMSIDPARRGRREAPLQGEHD